MPRIVKNIPVIPIPRPTPSSILLLVACKLFEVSCRLFSPVGAGVDELMVALASALDEELAAEAGDAGLDGDDVDGDSAFQTINESGVSGGQTQAINQGAVSGNPTSGSHRGQGLHWKASSFALSKSQKSPLAACAQSRASEVCAYARYTDAGVS